MKVQNRSGVATLQAALLLGISGNLLLRGLEPGINVLIWILLLSAVATALRFRKSGELWSPQMMVLNAALVFFAAMFAVRDSFELMLLNSLAVLGILAVMILPAQRIKVQAAGLGVYIISGFWAGIASLCSPYFVLSDEIEWKTLARGRLSGQLLSVSKGLVVGLPLVLVFGGLFMSADADYQAFVTKILTFNTENVAANIGFTILLSWYALGYLRTSVSRFGWSDANTVTPKESAVVQAPRFSVTEHDTEEPVPGPKKTEDVPQNGKRVFDWNNFDSSALPGYLTFGKVETAVVLGLMNLLFLSFIIVQVPYLFGGMDLVQSTPDFKLAEYARRGVGELIDVSLLVLPVLLVIHWLLRKGDRVNEKIFRILAGVQIGLLFVIMLSAVQRLLLLSGGYGYGLTVFRFYAMFMLIFLAMVFAWFSMTVLRGMRQNFAWGALWSGLFIIAALNFVNPDDFVVRTNVELMKQGRSFDAPYNSSLSADAVPALVDSFVWLDREQCGEVMNGLRETVERLRSSDDHRSWNWSRSVVVSGEQFQFLNENSAGHACHNTEKP